ncbi:adenylate kinase [Backusella circina FSU 941]|nr:adenylate kinase [Backusella circina FSU 941]
MLQSLKALGQKTILSTRTPLLVHKRTFYDCPTNAIQPLRLLLIGCPGSGKGTQSSRLQNNFNVAHLSSGDLLRRNITQQTALGQQASQYVADGQLVPDNLLISLIDSELMNVGNTNWLLDGFPRTLNQAEALDATLNKLMQPLNLVINLQVPEDVILQRIMDRWIHIPSGRVYNMSYNPPRVPGLDDVTGEPLSKRPDDTPEVFKVRMEQHHAMAAPLLDHYHQVVVNVHGNTSDEIYPKIEREIVNRLGVLPGDFPELLSVASIRQKMQQQEASFEEEQKVAAGASN